MKGRVVTCKRCQKPFRVLFEPETLPAIEVQPRQATAEETRRNNYHIKLILLAVAALVGVAIIAATYLVPSSSVELDLAQRRRLYFEFAEADNQLWLPVDAAVGDTHLMRSDRNRWQAVIDEKTDLADAQQAQLEIEIAGKYGIPRLEAEQFIAEIMREGLDRGWIKELPKNAVSPPPKSVDLFQSETIRENLIRKFSADPAMAELVEILSSENTKAREAGWLIVKAGQAKTTLESMKTTLQTNADVAVWISRVEVSDDFDIVVWPHRGQEAKANAFCLLMNVQAEYEHQLVAFKLAQPK